MKVRAVSLLAAAGIVGAGISLPAAASDLASHKAVYHLLPGPISGQTPYDGVEGLVTRSVERTCDGWIVAEHLVMRVLTRVGGVIDREIRFTSWEAKDGTRYRFAATIRSKAGDEDIKLNGRLTVAHEGGGGEAVYAEPDGKRVNIPEGTYLPIGQVRKLLAAARAGEKQTQFHVFDGTEENGPELMSNVVTGRLKAGEGKGLQTSWGPMGTGPGWRMSSAYFETTGAQPQSTPSYQLTMELLDNGVPRRVEMDLGGFVVIQALKEIHPLPEPSCG
ncbi:MAG: hypothetical protein CMM77_09490 [Rhodospirillaceae bacterium]|mgnify:CR=1 FL=1|nr:hypothetical protein [Magnetovibrio sp.]MAY67347.1 hypothetical protein [Rhodospirillaceae bacterium]